MYAPKQGKLASVSLQGFSSVFETLISIVVSKIDVNRSKQTLASLPCFGAYR